VSSLALASEAAQHVVLLGTAEVAVSWEICKAIEKEGQACEFVEAGTLAAMHEALQRSGASVVLADDRILGGMSLNETLLRLTEYAPVALLGTPECGEEASRWVARGDVEFIARVGDFAPIAAAILTRRIRWAEQAQSVSGTPWKDFPADFAAILRHEINNPLTGILGNAELLLAHYRDKHPPGAAQRVETVIDLAVRLRESTRRLSNAVETGRRRS